MQLKHSTAQFQCFKITPNSLLYKIGNGYSEENLLQTEAILFTITKIFINDACRLYFFSIVTLCEKFAIETALNFLPQTFRRHYFIKYYSQVIV